jgi:predicted GNAT family acetyltransferase
MTVEHVGREHRFVVRVAGGEAVLEYSLPEPGVMDIESTFVPEVARGRGVGGALVEAALQHARERGWRVIPTCWYVGTWVRGHPEYRELIRK